MLAGKMRNNLDTLLRVTFTITLAVGALAIEANSRQDFDGYPIGKDTGLETIETCFSPAESCDQKLINFLNTANESMDIAIYSLTHAQITHAIVAAHDRGVLIRVVVDTTQSKSSSSKVPELIKAGIPVKFGPTSSYRGIMHNKYTILDGRLLETGSFNYTANASYNNFENQIYLSDQKTLNRFKESFEALWSASNL
jgi:phosphatidylserine/phosphatidylglycerophosphate/cardiolipin synthase-like enzyme